MLVVFSGNCGRSLYHFRLAAVKKVQELGYSVKAVLPKDDYIDKLKAEGIEVVLIKEMQPSGTNPAQDYKLYQEYLKIYRQLNPSLIFEYTIKPHIYSTLAAKKLHIPCIAIVSGLGFSFTHSGIIASLARKVYGFALQKTEQVWFSNNEDKLLFEQKGFVNKNNSVLLNSEGIDTDYYQYAPIDYTKRSFVLMGRLLYDKGVKIYYEAALKLKKKYPFVSFKILGFTNDDDPRSVSKKELNDWEKTGAIEYLGSTTNVKPFIEDSTCVVLPSFYKEGMSTALMEAASMGRPLIATDIPGCRELIDHNVSGFICKPKDVDDLLIHLEALINMSNETLHQMSIRSREKMIKEFSMQRILPIYEKAVKDLTK